MHNKVDVPSLPPDFTSGDGVSWPRLVTGLMLLVLSLVMGYRSAHRPPPPKAEPHPVRDQLVVSAELPPLKAETVRAPTIVNGTPTEVPSAPETDPVPAFAGRESPVVHPHSFKRLRIHRHSERRLLARTRFVRTRAQVRREYFRDREFAAALTGEDSGSVYITRMAVEQREAHGSGRRGSLALRSARG